MAAPFGLPSRTSMVWMTCLARYNAARSLNRHPSRREAVPSDGDGDGARASTASTARDARPKRSTISGLYGSRGLPPATGDRRSASREMVFRVGVASRRKTLWIHGQDGARLLQNAVCRAKGWVVQAQQRF
jgi:hypothetical protein